MLLGLLHPWHSKIARTLASMAELESIGVQSVPEVKQLVSALVVSPDEALSVSCLHHSA